MNLYNQWSLTLGKILADSVLTEPKGDRKTEAPPRYNREAALCKASRVQVKITHPSKCAGGAGIFKRLQEQKADGHHFSPTSRLNSGMLA